MVDSVNIENVGDDGGSIASEVTLKRLLATMELMANKTGANSQEAIKKANEQYKKSIKDIDDATLESAKAKVKNKKQIVSVTGALRKFASVLSGTLATVAGSTITSFENLGKAILDNNANLSTFANTIPLLGGHISILTDYISDTFDAFKEMAMSGAAFNSSLNEIRLAQSRSRMGLDEFTNFITANSEALANLAGSATKGAKAVTNMTDQLGSTRQELLALGFNFQEINEAMLDYAYLTRSQGRLEQRNTQQVAQQAADYAKNLSTLSKLTGKSVDKLKEEQQAAQQDIAFQIKLSKMSEQAQAEAQRALANASLQGPAAVARAKELILGLPPMTEETRIFAAMMSDANSALENTINSIGKAGQTIEEFDQISKRNIAKGMASALEQARSLGTTLSAGIAQMDGPLATFGQMFLDMGIDMAKYGDKSGQALVDAVLADVAAAEKETNKRGKSVEAIASFTDMLSNVRKALHEAFIASGVTDAFINALGTVNTMLKEENFVEYLTEKFNAVGEAINGFLSIFKRDETKTMGEQIDAWWEEVKTETGKLWDKHGADMVTSITDSIIGLFSKDSVISAIASGISTVFAKVVDKIFGTEFSQKEIAGPKDPDSKGATGSWGEEKEKGSMFSGMGGMLTGLVAGVAALASTLALAGSGMSMILKGGAAIGGAIALIGTGVAGASWVSDGTFNTLIDTMSRFTELNIEKMSSLGNALFDLSAGLASFTGAGVLQGVGGITQNVSSAATWLTSFLPGADTKGPLDRIKEFGKMEFNAEKIKKNAEALNAFGTAFQTLAKSNMADIDLDWDTVDALKKLGNLPAGNLESTARGMQAIANLRGFDSKLESLNNLDASNVEDYRKSLDDLVETLKKLNEELSGGSDSMFSTKNESGKTAGDVISQINPKSKSDEVNTSALLSVLEEIRDLNKRTLRAINEAGNLY